MSDQEDYSKGYFSLPRQLRIDLRSAGINVIKLVWFVADLTIGWDASRWVALSYDEILNGRKKWDGERMEAGSGISNDPNVRRAVKDALAAGYIEMLYDRGLTYYAIHHRYWARGNLTPKWILFKRIGWTQDKDPIIDDSPPAINKIAQPLEVNGSAILGIARDDQEDSSQLSPGEQAVIKGIAAISPETSPQQARQEGKDTSLDTSKKETQERNVAASPIGSPPSIAISQKEKEENGKDEDAPSQESTPESSEVSSAALEEDARRAAAELEAKERQEAEEKRRQAREEAQQARKALYQQYVPIAAQWGRLQKEMKRLDSDSPEYARLEAEAHPLRVQMDTMEQQLRAYDQIAREG